MRLALESGSRRIYKGLGGSLTVEVSTVPHEGKIERKKMDGLVRRGIVPEPMRETLGLYTQLRLPDGTSVIGLFDPTVHAVGPRTETDYAWMLEATDENETRLVAEVERMAREWARGLIPDELEKGGE